LATVSGIRRYDLLWYLLRGILTGSALIVLVGLLFESVQLFRREKEKTAQLLRSREKLAVSEARFRQLADAMPQLVWTANPDGRVDYYNIRHKEYQGVERMSDGTFRWNPVLHKEDEARTTAAWEHAWRTGEIYQIEHRVQRADGSYHWHLSRAVPVRNKGEIKKWFGTATDIDVVKRTEAALRRSEFRLAAAIEIARLGIWEYDPVAEVTRFDDRSGEIFGTRVRGPVTTDMILAVIHPDDRARVADQVRTAIESRGLYETEYRILRPDGTLRWVAMRANAVTYREGDNYKYDRFIGTMMDITAGKEAEEQLRQAQKLEAIGQLAGGVAHEFNNMLNVILGYADILGARLEKESPLGPYVREIQQAARRSAKMTGQLLAYSRKQLIRPRVIDFNGVIGDQMAMLDRLIGETIDVRFLPGKSVWPVRIDPHQVDQILANLAINARDAGTGQVTLTTENKTIPPSNATPELPPGDYVRLTFSDTGTGMDEATLERIFEPYFTTKEVGKGTGLGLSMVYGIMKQNHGEIFVESRPGEGTTFTLYFPRSRDGADTDAAVSRSTPPAGGETVLVVEDEPQVLHLAETILKESGYQVLTAHTPGEAIDIARDNGRIDLLLSDMIMPDMNGKELQVNIETIRPGVRTLFMSGYTDEVIGRDALRESAADFIEKPFTLQSLAGKVREVLDR